MTDIVLLFPPQWSPFQPPLSLPSLTAWLRREGFFVRALDANIDFYHWLYGDTCVSYCKGLIDRLAMSADERMAHGALLDSAPDFVADISGLQRLAFLGSAANEDVLRAHILAINSMEIFLDTISRLCGNFKVSPFSFTTAAGDYDWVALQKLVQQPPPLLAMFVDEYLATRVAPLEARSIGLSCIGQEQLFFSLLFGKRAKELLNLPVIIGGTIFSRIFERGVLPVPWFERYFDIIVRNEGEKPASSLLENMVRGRKLTEHVPGIVYLDDGQGLAATNPCAPLQPRELPVPDFGDLSLESYVTSHLSLPLLSARGCYWGKCEFCHHGMVYGEKYGAYEAEAVLATVGEYAQRYGAKHFAFNDEAIPPKIARGMGLIFPDASRSSWAFTGLMKFEKFFTEADFANLRRIGFRSLYVGLESASERVLELMRKPNKKSTIVRNLTNAKHAGIWMHCFLFFGFPGESEDDARETYDFILENEEIIGSFGCCTFALEHNAPISRHLEDFPVQLNQSSASSVNVYYSYRVSDGISPERAEEWAARLNEDARRSPKYFASKWIPREHLLSLLSSMSPEQLVAAGNSLHMADRVPSTALTREIFSSVKIGEPDRATIAINRANRRALRIEGGSEALFSLMYDENLPLAILRHQGPEFYERLMGTPIKLKAACSLQIAIQPSTDAVLSLS
jgi:anaerobic magnesium-protoporphyrin IX monomethyl ester cyclase